MNGSLFDAWTRRRFGLATGGLVLSLLGLTVREDVAAKRKKRRKKRCRKLHQICLRVDGKKQRCCKPLTCIDETEISGEAACCRSLQTECKSESQCCQTFKCQKAVGLRGNRCCAPFGISVCEEDSDCCAGDGVICHSDHNCCRRVQASCQAASECCGALLCTEIFQGSGLRCCAPGGVACVEDDDCCFGDVCTPTGTCGD